MRSHKDVACAVQICRVRTGGNGQSKTDHGEAPAERAGVQGGWGKSRRGIRPQSPLGPPGTSLFSSWVGLWYSPSGLGHDCGSRVHFQSSWEGGCREQASWDVAFLLAEDLVGGSEGLRSELLLGSQAWVVPEALFQEGVLPGNRWGKEEDKAKSPSPSSRV